MKKKRVTIIIITALILISATAFCQTGNISGVVIDNSGYSVQDAEVFVYGSDIRDMKGEAWFDDIQLSIWNTENVAIDENNSLVPAKVKLNQNYPNPFNPSTTISFETMNLHEDTRIEIYNLKGQKVKTLSNNNFEKGIHSVIWNGNDENNKPVSSGIYFYQLKAGNNFSETKRMMLFK